MKRTLPFFLMLVALAALVGYAAAQSAQPAEASSVVNAQFVAARCSDCHGLDKTCRSLGKKDQESWLRTVKRMAEARGADITPATAAEVAAYLTQPDPALGQLCGD